MDSLRSHFGSSHFGSSGPSRASQLHPNFAFMEKLLFAAPAKHVLGSLEELQSKNFSGAEAAPSALAKQLKSNPFVPKKLINRITKRARHMSISMAMEKHFTKAGSSAWIRSFDDDIKQLKDILAQMPVEHSSDSDKDTATASAEESEVAVTQVSSLKVELHNAPIAASDTSVGKNIAEVDVATAYVNNLEQVLFPIVLHAEDLCHLQLQAKLISHKRVMAAEERLGVTTFTHIDQGGTAYHELEAADTKHEEAQDSFTTVVAMSSRVQRNRTPLENSTSITKSRTNVR